MIATEASFFVTGGTLRSDAPCYVERRADRELFEGLLRGEYCYVLTSRQMGKSSLMVRTAARLREEGVRVAILDLTAFGQNLSDEQWYGSLLTRLGHQLDPTGDLEDALDDFWLDRSRLAPLQRWMAALEQIVLGARCSVLGPAGGAAAVPGLGPVEAEHRAPSTEHRLPEHRASSTEHCSLVIFLDEIDVVRSLPFSTDELFAAIRQCYNRRTEEPLFERLTFCLLGVATPTDLIRNSRMTPFNIGTRVELSDFTEVEAAPLAFGLRGETEGERESERARERERKALLVRVLYWTAGHPYLTQRLCQAVAEAEGSRRGAPSGGAGPREAVGSQAHGASSLSRLPTAFCPLPTRLVDRLCGELFLSQSAREKDTNLIFVRDRVLHGDADLAALLDLYARVYRGRDPVRDDAANPLASVLRLAGLVRGVDGALRVRNRIYQRVFDGSWIRENIPGAELRRQRKAFWRGVVRTATVSAAILGIIGTLALVAVRQARRADRQAAIVEAEKRTLRRTLYAAQTNLAEQAWNAGYLGRALDLLEEQRPKGGEEDLRGFEWYLLRRLCQDQSDVSFQAHDSPLLYAAIAAGGKTLATEGADQFVKFWDLPTRREKVDARWHNLEAQPDGGFCVSPDGKLVAVGAFDGSFRIWDVVARRVLGPVKVSNEPLLLGGFSPDSRRLVTGSVDGTIQLWDVASRRPSGRPLKMLGLFGHPVAWSQNGQFIAAAEFKEGLARVWLVAGQREMAQLPVGLGVYWLGLSPDGKRLAVSRNDWSVGLWDVAAKREVVLSGHTSYVLSGAFSPDGKLLATGSQDCTIRLWSLINNQQIAILRGHQAAVSSVAFSPDGKTLLSASGDKTIKLWNLEGIRARSQKDGFTEKGGGIWAVAISPDSRILATGCTSGTVHLRSIPENRLLATLPAHQDVVTCMAFSPDGKTLATGSRDTTVKLWDVAAPRLKATLRGHRKWIDAVAWSPDGRLLASASSMDKTLRLWDPASKKSLGQMGGGSGAPTCLAFVRGRTLVVGTDTGTPKLWEVGSGKEPVRLEGQAIAVNSVAVSPDGKTLATAGWDDTVRLWDVATKRLIRSLKAHMTTVAFSPDDKSLCTGSPDGVITFWDLRTYLEATTLQPRGGGFCNLAFAPDGSMLATGGEGGMVRIWRTLTRAEADGPAGAGARRPTAQAQARRDAPPPAAGRPVPHPDTGR